MHDIAEKNPVCFILRFLHLYCIQALEQLDNNGCMYIIVKNFNEVKFSQQYGREQVNTAHANYIIALAITSWMIVANINVLWYYYATGALEMVQKSVYLKGESCSHS